MKSISELYELRRNNQLDEAWAEISPVLDAGYVSDEYKKVASWVLYSLCIRSSDIQKFDEAQMYFEKLKAIKLDIPDRLLSSKIDSLGPKVNPLYSIVHQAEENSKIDGNEEMALRQMEALMSENKLTKDFHESYGWIIYRYIKKNADKLPSLEVRKMLKRYMDLENVRPSLLHSQILNFASNYARSHSDFIFYNFLKLWNPKNLRQEDLIESNNEGKTISSLLSRICATLAQSNQIIELDPITSLNPLMASKTIDCFREGWFWKLRDIYEKHDLRLLWDQFDIYVSNYSNLGSSEWHSRILKYAEQTMKEQDSVLFLDFFVKWGVNNLRMSDWEEECGSDGKKYKPLGIRVVKKCFDCLSASSDRKKEIIELVLPLYDKARRVTVRILDDLKRNGSSEEYRQRRQSEDWLMRNQAKMNIWLGNSSSALELYQALLLDMPRTYYLWNEVTQCITDKPDIQSACLVKALSLEKNEDFLGEIHLNLAEMLISANLYPEAVGEMNSYKEHRLANGKPLSQRFEDLASNPQLEGIKGKQILKTHPEWIDIAEDFAYQSLDWKEYVLVDRWKNEGEERCVFISRQGDEQTTSIKNNKLLRSAKCGEIFMLRVNNDRIVQLKNTDLGLWSILTEYLGYIDYINTEKGVLHILTFLGEQIPYSCDVKDYEVGQYVTLRRYSRKHKNETRVYAVDVKRVSKEDALLNTTKDLVVVDDVNKSKELFHYINREGKSGIVHFNETELRPEVGTFLEIISIEKKHNGKTFSKILYLSLTDRTDSNLVKRDSGYARVPRNKYGYASFGFVGDYYVPDGLVNRLPDEFFDDDLEVEVDVVYSGKGKWKVFNIIDKEEDTFDIDDIDFSEEIDESDN